MTASGSDKDIRVRISRQELQRLLAQAGGRAAVEDIYPMTPVQQGMVFHSRLDASRSVYVSTTAWRLRGSFDRSAFERAWQWLVARHPVLRTGFFGDHLARPLQVVMKHVDHPLAWEDLQPLDPSSRQARIAALQEAARTQPWDFTRPPLMRVALLRCDEQEHVALWTCHHALLDGWSMPVVLDELTRAYAAYARGEQPRLPAAGPFRDYVAWLERQDQQAAQVFWSRQLAGLEPAPDFGSAPRMTSEQHGAAGRQAHQVLELSLELDPALLEASLRQCRVTPSTLATAAWALLLGRYTGRDEVCFGLTVSGRPPELDGIETRVGLFINTLPLRLQLQRSETVSAFLQRVQQAQAELGQFQYSALVDIRRWGGQPADTSLFDSILVFDNYPRDVFETQDGSAALRLERLDSQERAHYPLTIAVQTRHGLSLRITHDPGIFSAEDVGRYARHFATVAQAMVAAPTRRLTELPWLPQDTRLALARMGQAAPGPATEADGLIEPIWRQAAERPHALAVEDGAARLSFGELVRRVDALAARLAREGVGPESRVALLIGRSAEFVVAALAVLRVGAAYMPVDPRSPPARTAYMLADAAPARIVVAAGAAALPETCAIPALVLDLASRADAEALPAAGAKAPGGNVAYVMYTSGSTGRPKGVEVGRAALQNLLNAMIVRLDLRAGQRVAVMTAATFDISGLEWLTPLLVGASCVVVPDDPVTGTPMAHAAGRLDVVQATPSGWRMLIDAGLDPSGVTALCGGEALPAEQARELAARAGALWHVYGPTETTIWSSAQQLAREPAPLSVGHPIQGTSMHVLDAELQPVDIGIAGELCIGGAGLARGYLGRPALTAERFAPDPHSAGQRLYRTGDRARRRADGSIEFLGRIDGQIKLRGHRIEAAEVEAVLREAGAAQAKVILRDDEGSGPRLVAYVAPAGLNLHRLGEHLRRHLPQVMVPSAVVPLAMLPVTMHGKLDLAALPVPALQDCAGGSDDPPRGPIELTLAAIWQDLLRIDQIGRDHSFFDLGGHSLLAMRMLFRLRQEAGVEIPLPVLFQESSIRGLADWVASDQKGRAAQASTRVPIRPRGTLPALFFVPGTLGTSGPFFRLGARLSTSRALYALQPPGMDGRQPPCTSMEQMVQAHLASMRSVQEHGPYLLCGHSFGGLLAFEIARRLLDQGEQVSRVILLDSDPACQLNPAQETVPADDLRDRLKQTARLANGSAAPAEIQDDDAAHMSEEALAALAQVVQAQQALYHLPTPCPVRLVLVWAAEADPRWRAEAGWRELTPHAVEVHSVPGHHYSMLGSHVDALANSLDGVLRSIDEDEAR